MVISGNRKDEIFLQIEWLRLSSKQYWTWHSTKEFHEDVSYRVLEFWKKTKKKSRKSRNVRN